MRTVINFLVMAILMALSVPASAIIPGSGSPPGIQSQSNLFSPGFVFVNDAPHLDAIEVYQEPADVGYYCFPVAPLGFEFREIQLFTATQESEASTPIPIDAPRDKLLCEACKFSSSNISSTFSIHSSSPRDKLICSPSRTYFNEKVLNFA